MDSSYANGLLTGLLVGLLLTAVVVELWARTFARFKSVLKEINAARIIERRDQANFIATVLSALDGVEDDVESFAPAPGLRTKMAYLRKAGAETIDRLKKWERSQ